MIQVGKFKLGMEFDGDGYPEMDMLKELENVKQNSLFATGVSLDDWTAKDLKDITDVEKGYEIPDVDFIGEKWTVFIMTKEGKIGRLSLMHTVFNDEKKAKFMLKKTMAYLTNVFGKYDKHPFLTKKYIWFSNEANVMVDFASVMYNHAIQIILESTKDGINQSLKAYK